MPDHDLIFLDVIDPVFVDQNPDFRVLYDFSDLGLPSEEITLKVHDHLIDKSVL